MNMGDKIKQLRNEKGMTLEELGNKVGVGKSTVRKWETGIIANMKRDKILKVSEALGTSPAYLMGWNEEDKSQSLTKEDSSIKNNIVPLKKSSNLSEFKRSKLENQIIDNMENLNNEGKKSLLDYSKVLLGNSNYILNEKKLNSNHLEVVAAHERTDIEITNEMRKHDDDIMDDENF